jgi:uncharacterized membrane-anchored protein
MERTGVARLDRKTKNLTKRLRPGDIAIIDHRDLDQVSAQSLLEARVSVVINANSFSSGRYPNSGPLTLSSSGIMLVDQVGPRIFDLVKEGQRLTVEDGKVFSQGRLIAKGKLLAKEEIERRMDVARSSINEELRKFAVNTVDYLGRETDLILKPPEIPSTKVKFSGRHALVVVRGNDYKADLQTLRSYIREMKPVLIAVDGGADALLEAGFIPDLIVGDMDSVSDEALTRGAELIVHSYMDGRAPGKARLDKLGLKNLTFKFPGTSEDLALLLAYEKGADLIVAVGTHANLLEFLDKGREGMSSTFLVRLKVGERLVDAKGVSQLYRSSPSPLYLAALILAALTTVVVVVLKTPLIRLYLSTLILKIKLITGL